MTRQVCIRILPAVALSFALAAAASGQPMLLAGNEQALWLIRVSADGATYDLAARPAGGAWKWIDQATGGSPVSAAATNDDLHVLFGRPIGYLIYNLRQGQVTTGRNPSDPLWPVDTDTVAICQAPEAGGAANASSGLIAVVARDEAKQLATNKLPTSSAATTRKLDARTGQLRGPVRLGVFRRSDGNWSHLTDYPIPIRMGLQGRLLATSAGKALFVVVSDPSGRQNSLLTLADDNWREIPLTNWPARSHVIGLLSMRDVPVFVIAAPSQGPSADAPNTQPSGQQLLLATYDSQKQVFWFQPVSRNGKPVVMPASRQVLAGRLADRVALVWSENERLRFATLGLDGSLLDAADIDVFQRKPTDDRGQEILQMFLWGLLFAIFAAMFVLKGRTPPKPFSLPPTMHLANPFKRLLAFIIDFLPWGTISVVIFRIQPASAETVWVQIKEAATDQAMPTNYAYAIVTMLVLYTAYGIAMEHRFGATVGKMIFKLRVVGDDGAATDIREVLLRNLMRILELSWPLVAIPILLMLFSRNRQRLGDMMGRTAVIDAASLPPKAEDSARPDASQNDRQEQENDQDPPEVH